MVYLAQHLSKLFVNLKQRVTSYELFLSCSKYHNYLQDYTEWLLNLEKAYRTLLNDPSIIDNFQGFQKLHTVLLLYIDAMIESKDLKQEPRLGGELVSVCKDWNYKSRMALKSVIGRFKLFESTSEYESLLEKMAEIKALNVETLNR